MVVRRNRPCDEIVMSKRLSRNQAAGKGVQLKCFMGDNE